MGVWPWIGVHASPSIWAPSGGGGVILAGQLVRVAPGGKRVFNSEI